MKFKVGDKVRLKETPVNKFTDDLEWFRGITGTVSDVDGERVEVDFLGDYWTYSEESLEVVQ